IPSRPNSEPEAAMLVRRLSTNNTQRPGRDLTTASPAGPQSMALRRLRWRLAATLGIVLLGCCVVAQAGGPIASGGGAGGDFVSTAGGSGGLAGGGGGAGEGYGNPFGLGGAGGAGAT